jgi:hypothetical protein
VSTIVWIILGIAYFAALIFLGFRTLSKGHTLLFFFGIFLPILWVVGTLLPPTHAAGAAQARANLR